MSEDEVVYFAVGVVGVVVLGKFAEAVRGICGGCIAAVFAGVG